MPKYAVSTRVGCVIEAASEEAARDLGEEWAVAMNHQSMRFPNSIPRPEGFDRPIYSPDLVVVTDATQKLSEVEAMGHRHLREGETLSTLTVAEL